MVYLCFSNHLQVLNKVYEQCSANWHSIHYGIETILTYYVIKKVFVVYKQIIIIVYGPAVYLISKLIKSCLYTTSQRFLNIKIFHVFKEVSSAQKACIYLI